MLQRAPYGSGSQGGQRNILQGSAETTYCRANGLQPLPATPQSVVLYVTDLADRAKLATIKQRLVAIAHKHKETGLESPVSHEIARRVVQGIGRTKGATQRKKAALTLDGLRSLLL